MAFSFSFSGDDIDADESEVHNDIHVAASVRSANNALPELEKARKHDMSEWLSTLPSQISYNTLTISDTSTVIARREIFDIRAQLMAEDSAGYDNEALIAGLEEGDLKPHFYEGGFKTWECALDLAKLVTVEELSVNGYLASADAQTDVHIIELGAGTAVPSLALFTRILGQPGDQNAPPQRRTHFTFADYNSAVLRLVTLPNLLLTWYHSCPQSSAPLTTSTSSAQQPQDEELDITTELLETFTNDLARRSITVDFLSGAWSPELVDLIFNTSPAGNRRTLVLASETIYSPSSLISFSETLLGVLRRADAASTAASRALVAAKKVYFGIGGGVDEFLAVLTNLCGNELDVRPRIDVQSEGVGRVILELMRAVHRCFPQMI